MKDWFVVKDEYRDDWMVNGAYPYPQIIVDADEIDRLAKAWDKPLGELLDQVEPIDDLDEIYVYKYTGEPAVTGARLRTLTLQAMRSEWDGYMSHAEKQHYDNSFIEFASSELQNRIDKTDYKLVERGLMLC